MRVTWARVSSPRADQERSPRQTKAALRAARCQAQNLGAPSVCQVLRCASSIRRPMHTCGPLPTSARSAVVPGLPASLGLIPQTAAVLRSAIVPSPPVHGHGGLGGGVADGGCQPEVAVLSAAECPVGAGGR